VQTKELYFNNRMLNSKFNPKNPSVIFTIGPTGSGKSMLLSKSLNLLYGTNNDKGDYNSFLIDDYIETSPQYKRDVYKIIDTYECNTNMNTGSQCDLINPSKNIIKNFQNAYFTVREKGPCNDNGEQISCKKKFNKDLEEAIDNRSNILIEVTGKKIPLEYINKIKDIENYNFIFSYSIVSFKKLIERNKTRAKNQMKNFITNHSKHAPRLPNISTNTFKQTTKQMVNILLQLRNICLKDGMHNTGRCGPIGNNNNFILLIFDNDNATSKVIYDSRKKEFTNLNDDEFSNIIHSYNLDGGSKVKHKYK